MNLFSIYNNSIREKNRNSIVIGYQTDLTNQATNSIILNASGSALTCGITNSSFYVNPIRVADSGFPNGNLLLYNSTAKEVYYSSANTSVYNKTFVIEHPIYDDKYLIHACLEGPEVGVYYRGESKIENDKYIEIELPEYVYNIATDFTIQLTPIREYEDEDEIIKIYQASRIKNNKFRVYGRNGGFYWHVYGKRNNLETEPYKFEYKLDSVGPYTWLSKN